MTTTTPLDTALAYLAAGWPVFPCRAKEEADPHTGEVFDVKTPYPSNGLKAATQVERIVREWWRRTPDAMIGLPTGPKSGVWVLDLDVKPGVGNGHEWLERMEEEHGPLPGTARVRTLGGGTHLFFNYVEGIRNRGGLGTCVDVRGAGGYVIAPGSVAVDGRHYEWLDHDEPGLPPIADAPQWLLDLVLPPKREPRPVGDFTYTPQDAEPYVNAAVEAEMRKLASTGQGGRGYQLNASAFSLGQLVGAGVLSRGAAEAELYRAAQANGVLIEDGEPETLRKIKRGLDSGEREPRHIPDRSVEHDNTKLVDVTRMIENGKRKAAAKGGGTVAAAVAAPAPHTLERISPADTEREQTAPAEADAPAQEQPPDTPSDTSPINATPFSWKDPSTLPRREFAFGTHYIRKYVSVTVAPGGLGKTANSIIDALSMVSKRPLVAGMKPPERLRVWLFNSEDPRDELERRIMAACIHYGLKPKDIDGHLFLDTGREQELIVAREDKKTGVTINEPIVEAVVEQILRLGIDVMIVDPFVSTHSVNENDNGAIDKVAKLWAQIADYTNCAIDIVHHLRKVADREATVEDARGAVSLIGAARSVRVLNRMSEDQATSAGLSVGDRFSHFSITYGKSNLTPLSHNMDWRHLVSVPLGNGGKGNLSKLNQDFAPVVTEFKWPGAEDVVASVTPEQIAHICTLVDNAEYKSGNRAKNWVGSAVAEALRLDLDEDRAKARVTTVLKALLAEGTLVKVKSHDPVRREVAEFVRSSAWE